MSGACPHCGEDEGVPIGSSYALDEPIALLRCQACGFEFGRPGPLSQDEEVMGQIEQDEQDLACDEPYDESYHDLPQEGPAKEI